MEASLLLPSLGRGTQNPQEPLCQTCYKAVANRAGAFGFKWEWDGRASKHIPFDWSGPDSRITTPYLPAFR